MPKWEEEFLAYGFWSFSVFLMGEDESEGRAANDRTRVVVLVHW